MVPTLKALDFIAKPDRFACAREWRNWQTRRIQDPVVNSRGGSSPPSRIPHRVAATLTDGQARSRPPRAVAVEPGGSLYRLGGRSVDGQRPGRGAPRG